VANVTIALLARDPCARRDFVDLAIAPLRSAKLVFYYKAADYGALRRARGKRESQSRPAASTRKLAGPFRKRGQPASRKGRGEVGESRGRINRRTSKS